MIAAAIRIAATARSSSGLSRNLPNAPRTQPTPHVALPAASTRPTPIAIGSASSAHSPRIGSAPPPAWTTSTMPRMAPATRTTPRPAASPERYGGGASDIYRRFVTPASAPLPFDDQAFDEPRIDLGIAHSAEDPVEVVEPAVDQARQHRAARRELGGAEPLLDRRVAGRPRL